VVKNPRLIGDEHVKLVHQALINSIHNNPIGNIPKTVLETTNYILKLYPNIKKVYSKFDFKNTNQSKDLTIYLTDNSVETVNLFLVKKGARIQQKNLGAKSFFEKYFLSEHLQVLFNNKFEIEYESYLNSLVALTGKIYYPDNIKELRKIVKELHPKFTDEINPYRETFLYRLRENCFILFKDFYNKKDNGFFHAYNSLFMTEDINVVTSYDIKNKSVNVEEFNINNASFNDIKIYKRGKYTVGIKYGEVALTLRFKFESNPTSSIKLAVSYEDLHIDDINETDNHNTINKMLNLLNRHQYTKNINNSNAIGKCHEAITYLYFLKDTPSVSQVETDECVQLLQKYYTLVKQVDLQSIYKSTSTIVSVIKKKLEEKYNTYIIDSIELVPDSYISNRLDTGDLKLILRVGEDYEVENISLKALAKRGGRITTKNPGIGSILGPTYFNIGNVDPVVNEAREKFQSGKINHQKSLEIINYELGEKLKKAPQTRLRQGIENLLGEAMMAITFYKENISICKKHSDISEPISVYVNTPSNIQNRLAWDNDSETINLRVKFSRGKKHGWSSVKLTSEYKMNY